MLTFRKQPLLVECRCIFLFVCVYAAYGLSGHNSGVNNEFCGALCSPHINTEWALKQQQTSICRGTRTHMQPPTPAPRRLKIMNNLSKFKNTISIGPNFIICTISIDLLYSYICKRSTNTENNYIIIQLYSQFVTNTLSSYCECGKSVW